ncbi:hypothetical protein F0Q34_06295 [Pseudoroseomonas oryzae]|uniref:Uncharacterized protein n=2 Tax=Teichococcus oryzae TaxID=1608942 RepID=A0A5B2TIC4_9PROT|nr:hypothetical protein F0Q34_06295 [Pseudoroseomonas oryzae]
MMQTLPAMRRVMDDREIRHFVKKNGILLQENKFEFYQLDIYHARSLLKRMEDSAAGYNGIRDLPKFSIMGLIGSYDLFLSDLIKVIFITKPEILSGSDKNISFKDLIETGSIEAVRNKIIEKEVESVIRSSHAEQIEWLEAKLKITLRKDLEIWPDFIELCERRNLLTHTGGTISSQYLKVCKDHGHNTKGIKVGSVLSVTPDYYKNSVEIIQELGIKLIHVIWRKLSPQDLNIADRELDDFCYRMIVGRKYKQAEKLLHFGLKTFKRHGSDATRKQMVINYANTVKLGGNKEKAIEALDEEDWSASTENYRICVAAIKDDLPAVTGMMKSAVNSGRIRVSNFREWPVFDSIRSDPMFVEAFEAEFGEPLLLDQESSSLRNLPSHDGEAQTDLADTE